jgi:hypothetical protein
MGLAIILIPGGFQVESAYATPIDFYQAFALYVSPAILPFTRKPRKMLCGAKLTNLSSPDLRLVHLHIPPMDPDHPLDAGFQLAVLHGLDHLHLPRSRVSRCPQHSRWTPASRTDRGWRRFWYRRGFHRVV